MKATHTSGRPPASQAPRTAEAELLARSYSARGRAARLAQGKPEVVADPTVLTQVSEWISTDTDDAALVA